MNHFLTVFYCFRILLKILQMMACCLSLRHPTCSLGHGKSAPQKGLTYICEAFLHGKEHTTGQAFRHAPHFAPGRYALCFPFSSALNRSSLLSIPSLLLHGWAPAGFLRGLRRCCFYMDSHGGGEEVSGGEKDTDLFIGLALHKMRAVHILVCPAIFAFLPADWDLSTFRMTREAGRKVCNAG